MNISFSILIDECGKCVAHQNHQINTCICDIACDVCSDFKIHVRKQDFHEKSHEMMKIQTKIIELYRVICRKYFKYLYLF